MCFFRLLEYLPERLSQQKSSFPQMGVGLKSVSPVIQHARGVIILLQLAHPLFLQRYCSSLSAIALILQFRRVYFNPVRWTHWISKFSDNSCQVDTSEEEEEQKEEEQVTSFDRSKARRKVKFRSAQMSVRNAPMGHLISLPSLFPLFIFILTLVWVIALWLLRIWGWKKMHVAILFNGQFFSESKERARTKPSNCIWEEFKGSQCRNVKADLIYSQKIEQT